MTEEPPPPAYGGQAVLEGVMMRGPEFWAVAVRRPDGGIWVEKHPVRSLADRRPIFRRPFLRGISVMADALNIGMRAMSIAASQSMEEEQRLNRKQMGGTIALSVTMFIGIFIVLPNVLSNILKQGPSQSSSGAAIKEAIIRLLIFVGYLLAISLFGEIRRVFQYHAAEHQTIHAYENREPRLTPDAVMKYPTEHVRCGTNFLIITMLLTIVFYSLLGRPAVWLQITERVVGIFIIAGISYEFLRLGASKGDRWWVSALMKPGIWLQKITTRTPRAEMVEVAVRSFEQLLPMEERSMVPNYGSPVIEGEQAG
ncbi:MAG: DUF1385 domain-containing protein [Actinomycetota bacterium]